MNNGKDYNFTDTGIQNYQAEHPNLIFLTDEQYKLIFPEKEPAPKTEEKNKKNKKSKKNEK